jgi:hypothetical protein
VSDAFDDAARCAENKVLVLLGWTVLPSGTGTNGRVDKAPAPRRLSLADAMWNLGPDAAGVRQRATTIRKSVADRYQQHALGEVDGA